MKKSIVLLILTGLAVLFARTLPQQEFVTLGDIELFGGEILKDCRVGYRIIGYPNKDTSNVVIYPSWHGGTSEHIVGLVNKYNFVDTSDYCIIAVDALGNGISSSPSNSATQAGEKFPDIHIVDMAKCVKAAIDRLGINHVHAIVGGSMGSMLGFEFICEYPDFADKAVLYVSSPRNSVYDNMRREVSLSIIEMGRTYGIPEEAYMKPVRITQNVNAKTPEFYSKEIKQAESENYMDQFDHYDPGIYTADNFYCQTKALRTHDISWRDKHHMEKTAKRIMSDVLIIVNLQDHTVSPWEALDLAKKIGAKTLKLDNNRGHLGITYEIKRVKKAIRRFLK